MNRAVKLNYLFIGVIGGMVAMWACGGKRTAGPGSATPGGDNAAYAQDPPGTCKQWATWTQPMGNPPTSPKLSPGEEPFATAASGNEQWLSTRKCTAWN